MLKEKLGNLKYAIVLVVILVVLAQFITAVVRINKEDLQKTDGIIKITYVENSGAAFGIGENKTFSYALISIMVIGVILYFLINQRERMDKKTMISLSFMLAGGISNLIDRLGVGAVIDYIDVSKILKFPVFNLADVLICLGWVMLIIFIIVYWLRGDKITNG